VVVAWRKLAGVVGVAIAGLTFGCSDKEDPLPPAPNPCAEQGCTFPYATFDGSTPKVSLRRDLLANRSGTSAGGVFRRACSAGPCHGDGAEAGLFLGPATLNPQDQTEILLEQADVDRMLGPDAGVMRRARTVNMPIVDPGNPQNSFLMRKIDNCYDDIASGCVALEADAPHACGDRMPWGALEPLCADERDMIRRWIAQGATDDG
jgi:hypothetical protein